MLYSSACHVRDDREKRPFDATQNAALPYPNVLAILTPPVPLSSYPLVPARYSMSIADQERQS